MNEKQAMQTYVTHLEQEIRRNAEKLKHEQKRHFNLFLLAGFQTMALIILSPSVWVMAGVCVPWAVLVVTDTLRKTNNKGF